MITDKLLRIACLLVLVCPLSAQAEDAWDGDAVARLQAEMTSGATTSRRLVEQFLARIDAIDKHGPSINSVRKMTPRWMTQTSPGSISITPNSVQKRSRPCCATMSSSPSALKKYSFRMDWVTKSR